jgi:hypothetical protein
MKKIFLLATLFALTTTAIAQNRSLKKVISFVMPEEGGSNGASVVYHPVLKKYYAAMAGNASYPFAVFDVKGKLITSIEAGFDVRGMWYNSKTKTIQANGYNDFGWTNFILDVKGKPTGNKIFVEGLMQPNDQSVGLFNDKLQKMYFLNDMAIIEYDLKGNEVKTFQLFPNIVATDSAETGLPEYYNRTPIFTGIIKSEIGLLNNTGKTIELYNLATGKPSFKWQLPADIPDNAQFNIAYTNSIVWLFNKETRTWLGYK